MWAGRVCLDISTYRLIHIPTPMLASLLRLDDALVHLEVPVHVRRLPPPSLGVCLEAPPALGTWWSQGLIDGRKEVGSEPG